MKKAISGADALVAQAVAAAADGTKKERAPAVKPSGPGTGSKIRGWLMTGVSYVIPFVAAGGLLIALGFALGGFTVTDAPAVTEGFDWASQLSWAALFFQVGSLAFGFLVPVLGGFIAYAIADRPALVPGFVGGAIAVETGAGFLGGLVAGFLAGGVVYAMKQWKAPKAIAGIMPVLVLPLIGTLVVGVIMFVVIGGPLAALTLGLTDWLNGLSGANALLLGGILGLMMAVDMGGPVNKAAYTFAVAGLSTGSETALVIMAAVMAAGMTPPLAMALATVVRKKLFSDIERENGRAAWLLGASFITEGPSRSPPPTRCASSHR